MSIFGLLGRVAKAGLSSVTGGVSDKILSMVKGSGTRSADNKKAQAGMSTLKDQVKVFAVGQKDGSGNAWGTTQAQAKVKQATQADPAAAAGRTPKPRKAKKAKAAKVTSSTPSKRKPPKGGLDLKAMGKEWARKGKPGRWIDYVKTKSNQIRKG